MRPNARPESQFHGSGALEPLLNGLGKEVLVIITRTVSATALASFLLALPASAAAQGHRRQPAEGSIGVGADFGLFAPAESALDPAAAIEGHADFYLTPRWAARFGVFWTDPSFESESSDSIRQVRLGGDLLYNWERGKWHPFAGGGIGAHLLQQKDNGRDVGDSESKLGGALLGGVEYFFTRDATVKGEARYQLVGDTRNGYSPSGLAVLFGIKKYF
jgi:Outer membrane protein beta-barrel domain